MGTVWAALIAVNALLTVVSLAAVFDLTREVRDLNNRVIEPESGRHGNKDTVYEVGAILPKLKKIVYGED